MDLILSLRNFVAMKEITWKRQPNMLMIPATVVMDMMMAMMIRMMII